MSRSTDSDRFFQTSHSLAEASRKALKAKNNQGRPIRLQSKLLAIIADATDVGAVYVAESAGIARRVVLDTGESTHIYRGSTTPLTSLALSPDADTLFAGSWDKSIWAWSTATGAPKRRYHGHTDFVKTLLCLRLQATGVLVSGSADSTIIIWSIETGQQLYLLRGGHTRGILALAVDPTTYPLQRTGSDDQAAVIVFSAGSDREIRRWRISTDLSAAGETDTEEVIVEHETSVYSLCFDEDDDLWTASADGCVKCLIRERRWEADTTLVHGDYVRAVAVDRKGVLVVSAGRDEEVKLWDKASGKPHHTYWGHFEEVTGLLLRRQMAISISIDGTIRQWSLRLEDLEKAVREVEEARNGVNERAETFETKTTLMTEDEERELAELMESDND